MRKIKALDSRALRCMNAQLITYHGGEYDPRTAGMRDVNVLHELTVDGQALAREMSATYPPGPKGKDEHDKPLPDPVAPMLDDVARLAAFYLCSIIELAPFSDGNLRTAWDAARTVLRLNRPNIALVDTRVDPQLIYRLLVGVKSGTFATEHVTGLFHHLLTRACEVEAGMALADEKDRQLAKSA